MIGVKITVLMIVISIISVFFTRGMAKNEDVATKIKMLGGSYPKYVTATAILLALTTLGIIYSTIYLLFFM